MTCGRLISSRYIHTLVSTNITITFSPSLTCWASMRGPCRSRVKVKARRLTLLPRWFERAVDNRKTCKPIKGKEFYDIDVQRLVNKHGINHYSMYSVMKVSVVERFNRTLKNDMWKMFTFNGNYKWINWLPRLLSNYNTRKDRTIGMRSVDITPAVVERLLATVYNAIKIAGPAKFKVGDSVRMNKYKTVLEKDYTPNWTTEVFKIVKVQRTNPVTYSTRGFSTIVENL